MGLLDWLRGRGGNKPSQSKGPEPAEQKDASAIKAELEMERARNADQEKKMREMEERFDRMQEKWAALMEKQQETMEKALAREGAPDDAPAKSVHPWSGVVAGPAQSDDDAKERARQTAENISSPLLAEKTFENFVVDDSNRFPFLAAEAVASSSSRKYNPLFIYGPVGVGKTHLLQAIANRMLERSPDLKVLYSSTERLTDELLHALETNDLEKFRSRYRDVDVILIDDIQMLSGREATQKEFFHMFNHLYNSKKQMVLCSDRPPSEIKELETRLRSRFEGGLIIDMKVPTFEGRRQILLNMSQKDGFTLSTEVLDYLAFYLDSNIRELEGGFNRVTAYASLMREPITVTLVKRVLEGVLLRKDTVRSEPHLELEHDLSSFMEASKDQKKAHQKNVELGEETEELEKDLLNELRKEIV